MLERLVGRGLRVVILSSGLVAALGTALPARAADGAQAKAAPARQPQAAAAKIDRSGRKRVGTASVYARHLAGRKMADGTRMDVRDDNAASKTLPLGTEARVTNLENGKSAKVTIQDRGPYVKGRIVDLSPATAERIGITPRKGVAQVEVAPLALPPRAEGAR